METKKNPKLNLEKKRGIFFQIGLVTALSLALVAFEWTTVRIWTPDKPYDDGIAEYPPIEIQSIIVPEPPKPKIELEKKAPTQIINPNPNPVSNPDPDSNSDPIDDPQPLVGFNQDTVDNSFIPWVPWAEVMPEFKGGNVALFQFLYNETTYPLICKKEGIEGTVMVIFIVEIDGSVSNIEIGRSVHPLLDKEAIRVVESMPLWLPGKQKDKKQRVKMALPLKFTINKW